MNEPAIDAQQLEQVEALLGREGRDTLLRLAISHAHSGAAAIRAAVAAGDGATVRREAHGLRGAMASVGAVELVAVLAQVERAGDGLDRLSPAMERLVVAAQAALGP